ncbi:MAG: hypothetical protein NUV83_03055 [Candidatus Wolfebacteria bacterium]|nr:hypothetical protein [Candidatus Wolfebacteria bacterium]
MNFQVINFKKIIFLIVFILLVFGISNKAFAATEFVSTIQQTGGDYATLFAWEAAINTDLTTSTTKVFSGSVTGTIADAAGVTLWRSSTSTEITGVSKHNTATQILIASISSSTYSFQVGDQWRVTASTTNYFQISDTGDSAIATAKIDGSWTSADTTVVAIVGWTTTSTNYINIYTTATARHNGKWDTGKYRLEVTLSADGSAVWVREEFTKIDGLQIKASNSSAVSTYGIFNFVDNVNSELRISNSIIKTGTLTAGSQNITGLISSGARSNNNFLWNNIIYDFKNGTRGMGIYFGADTGYNMVVHSYNNTIYNSVDGIVINVRVNYFAKNNIVQGANDGYNGTFATSSDYNISDIAGDAPNATFATTSKIVNFVSTSTGDFHLVSTDTSAKDTGTDLSADPNLAFTTDIDGQTRGSIWDIGADEL